MEVIHRSPGITAIYNELKSSTHNSVLDLGSASAASFQFFSRLSCHIHFESIDNFFAECGEAWVSGETLRAGLDEYLSAFSDTKQFDVILAWDIFNYLDRDTLQWLIARLNHHCRPNTLLHSIKLSAATCRRYRVIFKYSINIKPACIAPGCCVPDLLRGWIPLPC